MRVCILRGINNEVLEAILKVLRRRMERDREEVNIGTAEYAMS